MRYSKHLAYAERMFLRARLNRVRHITLDPDGPGVVRIHLVPCHKPDRETPFTAILNGQDILPLNVSWAILLTNFIEALKPYTGKEIRPEEWSAINAQAVAATRKIYRKTEYAQIESDLKTLVDCLCTIARGGEPPLSIEPVSLADYAPRMAAPHRMDLMVSSMVKDLHAASLDAVQITFYSADADIHNALVGVDGYTDTVNGIKNALAADLNVSLNTPLCSLNRDYMSVVRFAHELGIRYLTCSGLIPAGNAESDASRAVRLTPAELEDVLRPAMEYAAANGMEINFTSPGWLPEETLRTLGFTQIPSCGACLSNMAVAPDGTVLPCQSWLTGKGLGNMLRTPWPRIWHSGVCRAIRGESAKMERRCQLGATPMQEGC